MSSEETLMTDTTATTPESQPASQPTEQPDATAAPEGGQQQSKSEGESQQPEAKESKPEGPPEKYEFAETEGVTVDAQVIESFSEVAKELGLSQADAQKVLDKVAPVIASRQTEQIQAAREQWASDAKNDKEFGGDKLTENLSLAKKALDTFATPELVTLLNESGLGNHPEVIRVFVRAGKAISEDGFVKGATPGQPQAGDAKRFYPNSKMN